MKKRNVDKNLEKENVKTEVVEIDLNNPFVKRISEYFSAFMNSLLLSCFGCDILVMMFWL